MDLSNVRCNENPVSRDSDVSLTCEHENRWTGSEDTICKTFFLIDAMTIKTKGFFIT